MNWVNDAVAQGARKAKACDELGISIRTVQRWVDGDEVGADQRPLLKRPTPSNKLTDAERAQILRVCNQGEHADLAPSQLVPKLADEGQYLASESSFYRLLKEADQLHHRGRSKKRQKRTTPATHVARAPNEVWSWDITYLASTVRGLFYYLYLVEDIYSRKIVGWEVHERESGESAAQLMEQCVLSEHCLHQPLVLHADNGSPMKSSTLQAKLADLGITPSHSRPRVSNDNAFSESLFRTLKYCPQWPSHGFSTLDQARDWVKVFVDWYNNRHRHGRIRFVTPAQRHAGEDKQILAKRQKVYARARQANPQRWSGKMRNWEPVGPVTLNPEKVETKEAAYLN
jgi:putative transposase